MTKTEMAERIAALEADLEAEKRHALDNAIEGAKWKGAYEGMRQLEERTGVTVYVAGNSVGSPTCIYANGTDPDNDFAVSLYLDAGRNIVGVLVTDGQGDEAAGAGLVPYDRDAEL